MRTIFDTNFEQCNILNCSHFTVPLSFKQVTSLQGKEKLMISSENGVKKIKNTESIYKNQRSNTLLKISFF